MKLPARSIMLAAITLGACIALAARTPADAPDTRAAPDDRTISVGRWDIVSVQWDGEPVAAEWLKPLQVSYQADGSWAVLFKNRTIAEGRSTNGQNESPKTFEMETFGSQSISPTRYKGIYRVEGDTRVLCLVSARKPRPTEFSAPKRSGRMLVTLARPVP